MVFNIEQNEDNFDYFALMSLNKHIEKVNKNADV